MADDKIQTLHPQGKTGRNIDRFKYVAVKKAILSALSGGKQLTHTQLFEEIGEKLKGFQGDVSWYGETVKLDLEARNIIERTADKPQKYKVK